MGASLCSPRKLAVFGGYLDLFAFLDEEGDLDLEAGLEAGDLGGATGGVAANSRLRVGDVELDEDGKLQADGAAVVLVELEQEAVEEEVGGVADGVVGERMGLEALLIEEVEAVSVVVEEGCRDEFQVGLFELVLGLKGLIEDGAGEEVTHLEAHQRLAATSGGGGDVGVETDIGFVLELEEMFAFNVDCFDQCGHGSSVRIKYKAMMRVKGWTREPRISLCIRRSR